MESGLQECQQSLIRFLVQENFKKAIREKEEDICQFEHKDLMSVQNRLKEILDIYDSDKSAFISESARFIAEGMDYICNA